MLRIVFELAGKKVQAFIPKDSYIIDPQSMGVVSIQTAKSIAVQYGFERKQDNGTFLLVKNQIIVPILSVEDVDHVESDAFDIDSLDEHTYTIQVLQKDNNEIEEHTGFNQKWIVLEDVKNA